MDDRDRISTPATGRRLALLVLAVLRSDALHGYAIARRIEDGSGGVFSPGEGLLYPLLHELEQQGHLTSRWEEVSGRRRKLYAITATGGRRLEEERRRWETETRAVAGVIGAKEDVGLALG